MYFSVGHQSYPTGQSLYSILPRRYLINLHYYRDAEVRAMDPAWEQRKKSSIELFAKLKCFKTGYEEMNADAVAVDITILDAEKMKTLILDAVAALGIIQQKKPLPQEDGQLLTTEMQAVSNKVFVTSLATAMIHCGTDIPTQDASIQRLLRVFPEDEKQADGRSWLPLHWAFVADSMTEEDVKVLFTRDPMALQRYHQNDAVCFGYTPAHLLCMKEVTQRNMSLIRHFSIINQQSFIMNAHYPGRGNPLLYGYSALHYCL